MTEPIVIKAVPGKTGEMHVHLPADYPDRENFADLMKFMIEHTDIGDSKINWYEDSLVPDNEEADIP